MYWVRLAEITTGAGYSLLQLGQASRAAALIELGITLFDTPFDRDRQTYLTYLVDALARPGKHRDLEAAAGKGIEAICLAKRLSSARSVERIRDLAQLMKPYDTVPAVREFLERRMGLWRGRSDDSIFSPARDRATSPELGIVWMGNDYKNPFNLVPG